MHFTFDSHILFDPEIDAGYMKHYVPIPDEVAAAFEAAGVTYVEGTLDAHPFRRVVHLRPDGSRCLKFGRQWLDQADLEVNMPVTVTLAPDANPDHVEVPAELAAELDAAPDLAHLWESLSAGRRRTLVYGIERARRPETREKRAREIIADLRRTPWPRGR